MGFSNPIEVCIDTVDAVLHNRLVRWAIQADRDVDNGGLRSSIKKLQSWYEKERISGER